MPAGFGELVAFFAQPVNLPIVLVAGTMGFYTWRALRPPPGAE